MVIGYFSCFYANCLALVIKRSVFEGWNFQYQKAWKMNVLFLIFKNHSITNDVSFHSLAEVCFWMWLLFLWRVTLLILATLDFHGYIKRPEILLGNFSLLFFIVIYASVSCILSKINSFSVILLAFLFILYSFAISDCL